VGLLGGDDVTLLTERTFFRTTTPPDTFAVSWQVHRLGGDGYAPQRARERCLQPAPMCPACCGEPDYERGATYTLVNEEGDVMAYVFCVRCSRSDKDDLDDAVQRYLRDLDYVGETWVLRD
jgi:hypothetical protein